MTQNVTSCGASGNDALVLAYFGLPVSCLVICESALIVVTILHSPVLQENQYLFVLSLALTDIVLAVTSTTGACGHLPWIRPHINSDMLETITFGANTASVCVTGVHMSIIAIDRYIRIAHPFYYVQKVTKRCITKILYCSWILWILMACLPFVFSNHTNNWRCIYDQAPMEYCILILAVPVVNTITVFVCYFRIALLAVRHKKAAIARRHQNDTVWRSNNIVMKSIKFFVTMFGVYFLCVAIPFLAFCITYVNDISELAKRIVFYLFHVHSLLNFFICCGMDKRFFQALKITLAGSRLICRYRFGI